MGSLKTNTAANFAGTLFVAVVYLIALPIYLRLLGADAFGVVGLFFSWSAICAALDLGLGAALNREVAKLSIVCDTTGQIQSVLRTYEVIIWCMSAVLGFVLFFMLPILVDYWLQTGNLDKTQLKISFRWMAFSLALQMALSLYTNALWGLQKQIAYNVANSAMIALRLLGAVLILWVVEPNLLYFFEWQAMLALLHVLVLAGLTWHCLASEQRAQFDFNILKRSRSFIFDIALATLLATLLTHMDKILLSKLFSLREYGYYMIAWSVASVLGRLAVPVYSAWVPRLTQYVASRDVESLKASYFQGLRFLAMLVLPIALVLVLFPKFVLMTYTHDADLAQAASVALVLLSIGAACNGLLLMPHAVALAHGWTRLSLIQNAVACLFALPLVYMAAKYWGLNGAGAGWMVINALLLISTLPLIQRYCLVIPRKPI
jgi:O-antigen/teichoic acid export membrane protein